MFEQPDRGVGERVEALRRRAGLSRERLAGLAGLSPTLIKFVETGRRGLTLRAAQRIAPHLGVQDLVDLFGPTVRLTLDGRPSHPAVPAVRQALTAWHVTVDGEPATPEYLRTAVDSAWQTWHTSRQQRTEVAGILPELLDTAQRAVRLNEGDDRRASQSMLAQTYHIAQAFLAWHGDRELMWLTVDRGMTAALDADDPLAIASSCWYAAHLLRAVGRGEEALARLEEARLLVEPRVADGPVEYAATLADLHLCAALTKARSGDQGAWASWETARSVVERALPDGYVGPWTRVGLVLVDVYGVMCAVDLGAPEEATRRAHALDPSSIPSTERRGRHYLELARNADLEGSPEAALHLLQQAAEVSPETVQFSPPGRELIRGLVTGGPATIRAEAEALAQRVGMDVEGYAT